MVVTSCYEPPDDNFETMEAPIWAPVKTRPAISKPLMVGEVDCCCSEVRVFSAEWVSRRKVAGDVRYERATFQPKLSMACGRLYTHCSHPNTSFVSRCGPSSAIALPEFRVMIGERAARLTFGLLDVARSLAGVKSNGVPEQFLWRSTTADGRLLATSISMRMSWAARRQTSIAEDMAYCLIGLFDVKMPLLYGEGGERAFTRLQEEIMKTSTDQTIFAWGYGMPLKAEHAGLPFHRLLALCPKYFAHAAKLEN